MSRPYYCSTLLVDVPITLNIIHPERLRLFQNMELSRHIQQAQHVMDLHRAISMQPGGQAESSSDRDEG